MTEPRWTPGQKAAIEERNCNLLVAAAAGAGKTAVLVERIIRTITDSDRPVDVDRLLVVTFTNAAAAEMRERIGNALAAELLLRPESTHQARQLILLNRAAISTMHSFCLDVLRRGCFHLDIDPAFRVADETEASLLQHEVLDEVFEEYYERSDEADSFARLVDNYGGERSDEPLRTLVLQVYRFARSTPWPRDWLRQLAAAVDPPEGAALENLPWYPGFVSGVRLQLAAVRHLLEQAAQLAQAPGGPAGYLPNLYDDITIMDGLMDACGQSWDHLAQAFASVGFSRLKRCGKDADDQLKSAVQDLRNSAKKAVCERLQPLFGRSAREHLDDLKKITPTVGAIVDLVQGFDLAFREAKAERALVDFADLEHYCLQILLEPGSSPTSFQPSAVAREIRDQYIEILVDEYQDINPTQETIIRLVSREAENEPNLFMVGDVKQSIYRFRLADPGLFLAKFHSYPVSAGGSNRRIDLTANFRSRPDLIAAINFLFRHIMTPVVGEMAYDRDAELVSGTVLPAAPANVRVGGKVEVHLIDRSGREEISPAGSGGGPADGVGSSKGMPEQPGELAGSASEPNQGDQGAAADAGSEPEGEAEEGVEASGEDLDAAQLEARFIALRIKEMVEGQPGGNKTGYFVFDKRHGAQGGYRPVTYRDIVVLLRATRGWANILSDEFQAAGVPVYAELGSGYFEATEIETLLALLTVIDNPRQDIPLAAVLRSSLVGLSAADLAKIRLACQGGEFYDAVVAAAAKGVTDGGGSELRATGIADQMRRFLARLEEWRTAARRGSLTDLIWKIYRDTGYYDYVGALPGGSQRQANLRALHDRARDYEATSLRGLFRFLRFVEKLKEGGGDLGTARALGENEDVVRVMSIHKSKGLEFPVVIVAGLGKKFNLKDLNQNVLLHKHLGIGPNLMDRGQNLSYPTLVKLAIRQQLKMETLAEELRILYVAMTRARDKLLLYGTSPDLRKSMDRWAQAAGRGNGPLPDSYLASAANFQDWVVPALARKQPQVLQPQPGKEEESRTASEEIFPWELYLHHRADIRASTGQVGPGSDTNLWKAVRELRPVPCSSGNLAHVRNRLSWSYPWTLLDGKPAKVTVTEMKRRFQGEEPPDSGRLFRARAYPRPRFLQKNRGLTAAEEGTAMHTAMQHLSLDKNLDAESVWSQIKAMVDHEILTPEQATSINVEAIAAFFHKPLGQRVLGARDVRREVPFTLAVPADEVYPELSGVTIVSPGVTGEKPGELVLIQGIIDCLIDEGDGLVLIDFKTDRLAKEEIAQISSRYRTQLNFYARAVETILRQPVKEKLLYFFHLGQEFNCT